MFEKIRKKIEKARVYQASNSYEYFVYPYKGLEPMPVEELNYLSGIIAKKIDKRVDLIFTFETDGIFIAYPVASVLGKPLVVARKFHYNLKHVFKLSQKTGYFERNLFFSLGSRKIKKVAIVDCIHSTGGTLKSALAIFKEIGIEVVGIYVVINKTSYNDEAFLKKIKNIFFAIYDVRIANHKVLAKKSVFLK